MIKAVGFLALVLVVASAVGAEAPRHECPNPADFKPKQQELDAILDAHEEWLQDRSRGKRAILCQLHLARAYRKRAVLAGVDLREADLRYADLRKVKLPNVNLRRASLLRAKLKHT
ncbi:MAG: pentapeptide repeat-containing protein, partial [Acidiferrobacterales bacterium]